MFKIQKYINTYSLAGLIILFWVPFYLTFFPGVGLQDEIWSPLHPLSMSTEPAIYNILLHLFYQLGVFLGSPIYGLAIFVFFGMCVMASSIAYVILWLHRKNINTYICIILTLYYACMPIIIDYGISAVKDKVFAIVLLLMIPHLYELVHYSFKTTAVRTLLPFFTLLLLMICFRNNGIYIAIALIIILYPLIKEKRLKFIKYALIVLLLGSCSSNLAGTSFTEAIGVPLQQVCRVVTLDRMIPLEDTKTINKIMPIEVIKKQYHEANVDHIKWHPAYDRSFVDLHKEVFLNTWWSLFKLYPTDYFDAWKLTTKGFWWYLPWNDEQGKFGHAYDEDIYTRKNIGPLLLKFKVSDASFLPDAIKQKLGLYIWNYSIFISGGICFWLTILIGGILYYTKHTRYIIVLLPAILTSLTLIIATPLANCFRYTFYYVLCLPVYLLLPILVSKKREMCYKKI